MVEMHGHTLAAKAYWGSIIIAVLIAVVLLLVEIIMVGLLAVQTAMPYVEKAWAAFQATGPKVAPVLFAFSAAAAGMATESARGKPWRWVSIFILVCALVGVFLSSRGI